MRGNHRSSRNKHSNPHFKKKFNPRKETRHSSPHEKSSENSHLPETTYRILCPSRKIGSVLGKGGNIVKSLREETKATITVFESVPGTDERVIIISSPSEKHAINRINDENGEIELHCAAQDALIKVHERIVEEDIVGPDPLVTARLLVSDNLIGCILGRKGDVIVSLRRETGANIRVLPANELPACASDHDELVQVSAKPSIAKKALYEISTRLHQNPRKDKPPLVGFATPGFHSPISRVRKVIHPGNFSRFELSSNVHNSPPLPSHRGYGIRRSEFVPEDFDGHDALSAFTMKILCSAQKIGSVIGKRGSNIIQLEQETGTSIHVNSVSNESDERVIHVSSIEALCNKKSQTIDALLQLQVKTSELSEKGTITTRLLVPSRKIGCIIGEGGCVINEMRRRTHAEIRVLSKADKPKCASEDEDLVQISGSIGIAKEALAEIATRFRTRCLRVANATVEPDHVRPPPPPSSIIAESSRRYEHFQDGFREYEPQNYPVPRATGYSTINEANIGSGSAMGGNHHICEDGFRKYEPRSYPVPRAPGYSTINEANIGSASAMVRNHVVEDGFHDHEYEPFPQTTGYSTMNEANMGSASSMGGNHIAEYPETRMNLHDPYSPASQFGLDSELLNASRNMYEMPVSSARPNNYPQSSAYQSYDNVSRQLPYHIPNRRNPNPNPNNYPQSSAYQSYDRVSPQLPYHNPNPNPNPHNYPQSSAYQSYDNVSPQLPNHDANPNPNPNPNNYPQSSAYQSYNNDSPQLPYHNPNPNPDPDPDPQLPYYNPNPNPQPAGHGYVHTQEGSYQTMTAPGTYQY